MSRPLAALKREGVWGTGNGQPGCLFDNGPNFLEGTLRDAIESALWPFADCGDGTGLTWLEYLRAVRDLLDCGTHYFPSARRAEIGAGVVQVWEADPSDLEGES